MHLGHLADAIIQILQYEHLLKKEKRHYIAVGTVKLFIKASAKHLQWQGEGLC